MNARVAITHELKGQDLNKIPDIRVVRNALVQLGIKNKIAALFSPHKPAYNKGDVVTAANILSNEPVETHSYNRKIIKVITDISHDDELLDLLKNNDIVIVHWRSLPNTGIIKSLQQEGYKVSVIAKKWNESPSYVIEKNI